MRAPLGTAPISALLTGLIACALGPSTGGSATSTETSGSSGSSTGSSSTGAPDPPTGSSGPTTGTTGPSTCGSAFPLAPDDDFGIGDTIVVPLRLEAPAPVSLPAGSRLNVVLYGWDRIWADLPATVVRAHLGPIDALPLDLDLEVPADPYAAIPAAPEDANFYLAAEIDVDADDRTCLGDYTLDWDKLTEFPIVTFPVAATIVVPMHEL